MWGCNLGGPFQYPFIGMLINTLMMVTIVYIMVLIVRSFLSKGKENRDAVDSLEIIKQKYASGEITEKEYFRMKDILLG